MPETTDQPVDRAPEPAAPVARADAENGPTDTRGPEIEALLRERAGYARRGLDERVKGVESSLKALGHDSPQGRGAPRRAQA